MSDQSNSQPPTSGPDREIFNDQDSALLREFFTRLLDELSPTGRAILAKAIKARYLE